MITGGERRRRWSEEDRSRILAAISEPGAVVADVARREDICTSLVFKWRRAARREEGAATGVIEVELKDVRVRIGAGASSSVIAATLKALRS